MTIHLAEPSNAGFSPVAAKASLRLGYRLVAVCAHCGGPIIVLNGNYAAPLPWVHRDDGHVRECPQWRLDNVARYAHLTGGQS